MHFLFPSNNMLYPKEDKENRILLYAVSNRGRGYLVLLKYA